MSFTETAGDLLQELLHMTSFSQSTICDTQYSDHMYKYSLTAIQRYWAYDDGIRLLFIL